MCFADAFGFSSGGGNREMLTQLSGSTNKAEVLEAMEFFRIAWEYQFDSAEVSPISLPLPIPAQSNLSSPLAHSLEFKKMLHLIWSKDNNSSTSEDGKKLKGRRSRLLQCYRSLYFDPLPDIMMEPKQQVNQIAKNMIEYVIIMICWEVSCAHRFF
jgi:condensin complex subunit 1